MPYISIANINQESEIKNYLSIDLIVIKNFLEFS